MSLQGLAARALLALLILAQPLLTARADTCEAELPTRDLLLPNGLRVVLHPDPRTPRVVAHLLMRAGVNDETPGREGMAHLAEHLLVEDTLHSAPGSLAERVAEVGGDLNAWTDFDATALHLSLPSSSLELALFLLSDRLLAPSAGIEPEEVERELKVIHAERLQRSDAPHQLDAAAIARALWPPEHPYARMLSGSRAGLNALDLAGLQAWLQTALAPDRCSLVLAGDFNLDQAEASVRRWFSDVPARPPTPRVEPLTPGTTPSRQVFFSPVIDPTLYLAWRTVPSGHPDEPALDAIARILASGRGSRLVQRLREERPIAHKVQAWTDNGLHGGMFGLGISTTSTTLPRLLAELEPELERFAKEGPEPRELERFKAAMAGSSLRNVEPLARRAEQMNLCLMRADRPDCLGQDLDRYDRLSPQDLIDAFHRWLSPDHAMILSVVPQDSPELALPGSLPLEIP